MSMETYQEGGLVGGLKEPGWFSLPNALIDLHLERLGSRGVLLYCLLARCQTRYEYPSVEDLRGRLKCNKKRVRELLFELYSAGLLNDADVRNVVRSGREGAL